MDSKTRPQFAKALNPRYLSGLRFTFGFVKFPQHSVLKEGVIAVSTGDHQAVKSTGKTQLQDVIPEKSVETFINGLENSAWLFVLIRAGEYSRLVPDLRRNARGAKSRANDRHRSWPRHARVTCGRLDRLRRIGRRHVPPGTRQLI